MELLKVSFNIIILHMNDKIMNLMILATSINDPIETSRISDPYTGKKHF